MEIKDFEPNTHKYREAQKEERRVQKVVDGPVKTKKKSEATKFVETFISEDVHKVKEYIWLDVLVPAVKKAISDIVTNGIEMILYGGSGRSNKPNSPATRVSYTNYSNPSSAQQRSNIRSSGYSYDDIYFNTRADAELVLSQMDDIMSQYGMVRVLDMYDLAGVTCNHTDANYGWTDIRSAYVQRVKDGFVIKMPRALPID